MRPSSTDRRAARAGRAAAAALALLLAAAGAAAEDAGERRAPCGTPEGVCELPGGSYRLVLPPGAAGPVPALVYLHGLGGSSGKAMQDADRLRLLGARGYAFVAPDGIMQRREIDGRTVHRRNWSVKDGRQQGRDDARFVAAVIADAARRGIDPGRVLLAGFSRGGSMVWDIACATPGAARAYAPVSGAFWEPLPAACAGPVDLFHTHGWGDRVVPIEGRSIRGVITQGDAFASLAILRRAAGCDLRQPDASGTAEGPDGPVWLRHWTSCAEGRRLDLMLHPGGHAVPAGWLGRALDWFEALGPDRRAAR